MSITVFEFSYKCVSSSLEELIEIKVIFILRQAIFSKFEKNGDVLNLQKSFPGRQLNAASHKRLKIQAPFQTENCVNKDV